MQIMALQTEVCVGRPEVLAARKRRQNAIGIELGISKNHVAISISKEEQECSQLTWEMGDKLIAAKEVPLLALQNSVTAKRKSAEEALVLAMRAGKFGNRYAHQAIKVMSSFVDRIILKAVLLKRLPDYSYLPFSKRARYCIDQSNVVDLIRWLRHNNVGLVRMGAMICSVGDRLEIIRPRLEWLKSVHVRGKNLGVVFSRLPTVFNLPFNELNDTIMFLENSGLRREWMGSIIGQYPAVLALPSSELRRKVDFFHNLGIADSRFGTMICHFPALLGQFSTDDLQAKVAFLRLSGLQEDSIQKAIVKKPKLLACSVAELWQPLVRYLYDLGIEGSGMERILAAHPAVFCLSLYCNIIPQVQFLRELGVPERLIGQLIVDYPALLTGSLDRTFRPVVNFLVDVAGVRKYNVGKVIAALPEIIGSDLLIEFQDNVRFYFSLGIKPHQLGAMVADYPMLLKHDPDILRPKYRYHKRVMQRPLEEIVRFPRYFKYNLKAKIIPRHTFMLEKEVEFDDLGYMLDCSNDEFLERVEAAAAQVQSSP